MSRWGLALACAGMAMAGLTACGGKGIYRDTFTDEYDREVAAWEATQKSCERGDQDACAEVGEAKFRAGKEPDHEARGLAMMQQSCDAGSWRGCLKLADSLADGGTRSQDLDRAVVVYQRACQLAGSDSACLRAPEKLPLAHGRALLAALCGPRSPMACSQLGGSYLQSRPTYRDQGDLDQAAVFHQRACQYAPYFCGYPAQLLAQFRLAAARAMFASGCTRGDGSSCDQLQRADANLAEDARLTARCEQGGDELLCADLAQSLLTGGPLGSDVPRALALLTPRCERTPPARFSCRVLGDFLSDRDNPAHDLAKGALYLERSSK